MKEATKKREEKAKEMILNRAMNVVYDLEDNMKKTTEQLRESLKRATSVYTIIALLEELTKEGNNHD